MARSREFLKQVFVKELEDRSVAGRRALAGRLMDEASKDRGNPADLFALLGGAIEAAKEGGDLPLCFRVADQLADAFELDALAIKADAAIQMNPKAYAADTDGNVRAGVELLEALESTEDFVTAGRVGVALQAAAAPDPSLQRQVQQRRAEMDAAKAARDKVAQDLERLKSAPDDTAANLAAGSYFCFRRDDWARGLPMLAKGSDPGLRELARAELARPTAAESIARIGDGWWDVAARQPEGARDPVTRHAASLYRTAIGGTSGLRHTLIEKRISEAASVPGVAAKAYRTDFLGPIDPAPRDPAVSAAVRKAVTWIYLQQGIGGDWETSDKPVAAGGAATQSLMFGGQTALAVLSLASAGEDPAKEPRLSRGVESLTRAKLVGVYPVSLRIQALAALPNPNKYHSVFQQDYTMISTGTGTHGMLTYQLGRPAQAYDLSCTQFGWLGAAAAQKQGINVSQDGWVAVARTLVHAQQPDGGWSYGLNKTKGATASMTGAGVSILLLAKPNLRGRDAQLKSEVEKAVSAGLTRLDHFYEPGEGKGSADVSAMHAAYTLLCLQRAGLLAGRHEFGQRDWYKESCQTVLKTQRQDGSWGDLPATCMNTIFLSRGSLP